MSNLKMHTLLALAAASSLGNSAESPLEGSIRRTKKTPKAPKYPFNEEELKNMAEFTDIKAKKKYLKELKDKYNNLHRQRRSTSNE